MDLLMGIRGERFVRFLRAKLRERKGKIDGYNDTDFAKELHVEYETLKGWIRKGRKSVDRLDLENYFAVEDALGAEFTNYIRHGGKLPNDDGEGE